MLQGYINYHSPETGRLFKYNVKAIDTSSNLSMIIGSYNYDAQAFLANKECEDGANVIDDRRVDIKLAKVVVQTCKVLADGKPKKAEVNADFFCRLAALIRYVKTHCNARNEEYYTGLQLASGDFEVAVDTKYVIPFDASSETLAKVTLTIGCLTSLWLKTSDFEIVLNSTSEETCLFPQIKDGWTSGIRFTEEYLGFPLKPKENLEAVLFQGMYTCIEDIVNAHPDKEFSWLLGKNYTIVDDEHLDEVCKYIMGWNGFVFYDTETSGLDITFRSREGLGDQLVGVVLSVKFGESFFFPTQMKSIPNLCDGDHWYFMEHYMRPILEGKELVAHNMSFDWKVSYIYDINANIVHDTMALIRLTLGAESSEHPMGLKGNAKILLHRDSLELSDLVKDNSWGESDIRFWDLPYELVRLYACADTDNTNGLLMYALQSDLLTRYNAKKIYDIEIAFSYAVAYQEFYGHRVNVMNLEQVRKQIGEEQTKYMNLMVDLVGHEFNPNSPKQLQKIMYEEQGIPVQISRKTNRVTTDKETLKKLAELTDAEDNVKYPFCNYLMKYREAEGVRKIVDKFPEHSTEDGFIFSSVMQYGTTTGRVSINNPNYQSYNDPIKKNVVPRPGYWMWDTDYSSVEYRVLGNMVGNENIKKNFEDPDFDYHAYQAAHMYSVPYSAVTKKLRKAAKGINFGLPYGMGDESLGVRVFGEASDENTRKAAALRSAYFKGQEDIRDWFEHHRDKGVRQGFTETYFGRRRYYNRAQFSASAIRRQAGNQVIQGTAADIYKTAVGRVFKRLCKEGLLGKVLLTCFVHDELLGECSDDINPGTFLKMLREEFEVAITNEDGTPWCPLYMGFGYGMSWYEAKSVELPIKLQWEFVEKYGDTGFPEWNGNGREFCDTIPDRLRDFDVRDVRNQLLDEDSQGKEIKPTLNSQLAGVIEEDAKLYPEILSGFLQLDYNEVNEIGVDAYVSCYEAQIEKYLDEHGHIQKVLRDSEGHVVTEFEKSKETQECIDLFCKLHDVDRTKVNLLSIEEYTGGELTGGVSSILDDEDDDDVVSGDNKQQIMDKRVDTFGLYIDTDEKEITFKEVPAQYMTFIRSHCNTEGKGYRVRFKRDVDKTICTYNVWVESSEINIIQEMYLQYFKLLH